LFIDLDSYKGQIEGIALVRDQGFTLLELMVAVAIISILAMMAGPSISQYIDKRKIINAAEAIYSQLQYARTQAISRSATVGVTFDYADAADESTWLMGISTNLNCDVTGSALLIKNGTAPTLPDAADDCTLVIDDGDADNVVHGVNGGVDLGDLVYHVTSGADFNGVAVDANSTGTGGAPGLISFNPTRGTGTNRTVYLWLGIGDREYEMRVVVGTIGRVRICTPEGARQVPGYTATTSATGCS
jgi:prepilin-type N-terminal cleavage/methylation domain-containing protein